MPDPRIAELLSQPVTQETEFKPSYLRPELMGGFGTPSVAALLQMTEPMGLSGEQLDRNAAMRGPILRSVLNAHPELMGHLGSGGPALPGSSSQREDMNSVMLKYQNWRAQQNGLELSPQQRVTQGFLDVRNPNSRF